MKNDEGREIPRRMQDYIDKGAQYLAERDKYIHKR